MKKLLSKYKKKMKKAKPAFKKAKGYANKMLDNIDYYIKEDHRQAKKMKP